jgi:large subunit ribosomal protein L10
MPDLKKQKIVSNLVQQFKTMKGFIVTEYKGLNVHDITSLREQLISVNSRYIVVKNSLIKIALKQLNINLDSNIIIGPVAIIINNNNDIIPVTKLVMKFIRMHKAFNIKTAFLDGTYMNKDDIKQISCIPSKEILINNVLSNLKMPIMKLVYVLISNVNSFIMLIKLKNKIVNFK